MNTFAKEHGTPPPLPPCIFTGVLDYQPFLTAALANLAAWAEHGITPPPSAHPLASTGTAVSRLKALRSLPAIPGWPKLDPAKLWSTRSLDLGPGPASPGR